MEWVVAVLLLALLGYLVYEEWIPVPTALGPRKRLCDYFAAGSVYEPVSSALARGIRLLEVHVYSDEDDQPMVAKTAVSEGYDFAYDNVSFESVCVDIVNDAFPSKDPCILSIVCHTDKATTMNRMAYHLKTTVRRHLTPLKDIVDAPIDSLANKLILVSGGTVQGTELGELINLDWNGTHLRRLTHAQAVYPRDKEELQKFTRNGIVLVSADPSFTPVTLHPHTPVLHGCQWNFYVDGPGGFLPKE